MALVAPKSPPVLKRPRPEYLPAYLSNGLVGLRVGAVPMLEGLATVSGSRAVDPIEQVEAFAQSPFPLAADLCVAGSWLRRLPGRVRFIEQRYDFECGELHSRFEFRTEQATASVDVLTFCSRSCPTVVMQETRVTVDAACSLTVRGGVDQSGIRGRLLGRNAKTGGEAAADGSMLWETNGALATLGVAYITTFRGGAEPERLANDGQAPLWTSYSVKARPGRSYVLRQLTSLVPHAMHSQPDRQASRLVGLASLRGFDGLRKENAAAWRQIWRGRLRLVGASTQWQGAADAAFYYLQASAHPSSLFSTAMFGLAYWPNHTYYFGHVMWDIETFAFPVLLLTAPETARAMLEYRFERLPAARRNARMNGYAGAQFPWESSPEMGEESLPPAGPLSGLEQHVNFSVALAFAQFAEATGDEDFARDRAWPVLEAVAEWTASRVTRTRRGYEIRATTGIAEDRTEPVNNDAYVNMAAATALRATARLARRLNRPPSRWEEIAARMVIPRNKAVVLNHDDFPGSEPKAAAATPEALAGIFPLGYELEPAAEQQTLRYYLERVDPYLGYPMLSAPLGVYAARLGDRALSTKLFDQGYAAFVTDPYRETNEFSNDRYPDKPRVGPLLANVGGFLTSLLYGLPRIRINGLSPDGWLGGPLVMPDAWDAIEVDEIFVGGRPVSLRARHGAASAQLEPH